MIDNVSPSTRSRMMRAIPSKNTKPELSLRKGLFRAGFRFRLHRKNLAGKPDIVLTKYNAVIFVHGCFWHRHEGCSLATMPSSHKDYWMRKFDSNVERDNRNREQLISSGWRVAIVWECGLRKHPDRVISDVAHWLKNDDSQSAEFADSEVDYKNEN
ncbi:MAG: very short patch repair endonuclease [Gammaproteobacteria bacterium]|nr:very short patch repair endonuclease [Gammaproteobacteria bacterium]